MSRRNPFINLIGCMNSEKARENNNVFRANKANNFDEFDVINREIDGEIAQAKTANLMVSGIMGIMAQAHDAKGAMTVCKLQMRALSRIDGMKQARRLASDMPCLVRPNQAYIELGNLTKPFKQAIAISKPFRHIYQNSVLTIIEPAYLKVCSKMQTNVARKFYSEAEMIDELVYLEYSGYAD